jgi:SAM-dependent methyltransferase
LTETYYSNVRHDILTLIPRAKLSRALEIGGGDFDTLLTLRQTREFETWGLDIRESKAALDNMIVGSVSDSVVTDQIPQQSFDLIIANDVIEHVADTEKFVLTIYNSLKPGGLLALSVPNARQVRLIYYLLFKGSFPREEAGLFDRTHLRWFTKNDVTVIFPESQYALVTHKSTGRLVPRILENTVLGEFLGLHNLFVFRKL